jgi:hypothetical protein
MNALDAEVVRGTSTHDGIGVEASTEGTQSKLVKRCSLLTGVGRPGATAIGAIRQRLTTNSIAVSL